MPVSCNAARRGKLTAEGIASRVTLYDNCGIMEMNSTQNTKRTRFEHLRPRRVRTIKMAPRVGFEPTTLRLTAGCSAVELPRNFFGALRFLGARKYYRHFNFRRNPLFQKFFQQPIPGAWLDLQVQPNTLVSLPNSAGHVRPTAPCPPHDSTKQTSRHRRPCVPRTSNGEEHGQRLRLRVLSDSRMVRKLFAESWQRMRVFQMVEGDSRYRMPPKEECAIVYYMFAGVHYNSERRPLSNFRKTRIPRRDSEKTSLREQGERGAEVNRVNRGRRCIHDQPSRCRQRIT